ncbi:MAG: alcohol dehydrogenase catalytic domain-containing protein [Candidatus Ratteibacteria bacterium]|jgi:L-iditol 2-dehydrogenase
MKAAFLVGKEKIEIREVPRPVPGTDEVLVRVKRVGICGSDVHYFRDGKIGEQIITGSFVVGHEASGEVAETGSNVKGFKAGQKVAIEPGISCGKCEICLTGKPNLCTNVRFLGTPPIPGAFREYLTMPAANLMLLPENVSFEEGVLAEPMAIGLYAVNLVRVSPGDSVAVFGCGPIGLSVIFFARLAGAASIFASDLIPERRSYAKEIGADCVFDPKKENPVKEILSLTEGRGVRSAFEAAGQKETLVQAIDSASLAGRVGMVGIPADDYWQFPSFGARRKELALLNVRRSAFAAEKVIRLIAARKINPEKMVTHHFPLEKLAEAMRLVAGYREGVIKAIIDI